MLVGLSRKMGLSFQLGMPPSAAIRRNRGDLFLFSDNLVKFGNKEFVFVRKSYRYSEPVPSHGPNDHPLPQEGFIHIFSICGCFEKNEVRFCRYERNAELAK